MFNTKLLPSLVVLLGLLSLLMISCSNNGPTSNATITDDDGPGETYWTSFCWDIKKEGGGYPTWNFLSRCYYVIDPQTNPPTLGYEIDTSNLNDNPYCVSVEHDYQGFYVAFISFTPDGVNPPGYQCETGYTIWHVGGTGGFVDGELVFPYQ